MVRSIPPFKPGVTQGNMRILTDNPTYPQFDMHLSATHGCDVMVVLFHNQFIACLDGQRLGETQNGCGVLLAPGGLDGPVVKEN